MLSSVLWILLSICFALFVFVSSECEEGYKKYKNTFYMGGRAQPDIDTNLECRRHCDNPPEPIDKCYSYDFTVENKCFLHSTPLADSNRVEDDRRATHYTKADCFMVSQGLNVVYVGRSSKETYAVVSGQYSNDYANAICTQNIRGRLPSILNEEEFSFIKNLTDALVENSLIPDSVTTEIWLGGRTNKTHHGSITSLDQISEKGENCVVFSNFMHDSDIEQTFRLYAKKCASYREPSKFFCEIGHSEIYFCNPAEKEADLLNTTKPSLSAGVIALLAVLSGLLFISILIIVVLILKHKSYFMSADDPGNRYEMPIKQQTTDNSISTNNIYDVVNNTA